MSTTGKTPPPVCKVNLIRTLNPDDTIPENCTTVTSPFMYVVLSSNPDNDNSATVSWSGVDISVQTIPGNELILRGATAHESAPDTVTVQFDGCDPTNEPCETGTCVPEGC